MDDSVRDRFEAIGQIAQPAKRGLKLESFVGDLFRQEHFKVDQSPGIARPRQTDVLAVKASDVYLIECKWRHDKANIDDLDSLRSRLQRVQSRAVGILVSVNGFSGTAVQDVEHHRAQPILLVSGDELLRIADGFEPLSKLLWRKQDALLTDGRVLLDEPSRKQRGRRRTTRLPAADTQFLLADMQRSQVMECDGDFGQFVFTDQVPDIDWVPATGRGVTLDVQPRVFDQNGLLDLLDNMADLGWATVDARWSIQQATKNWHGLGAAAFAHELPKWRQRAATPAAHDSEEICYVDRCDGGFYTLTANMSAHTVRRTIMVSLSFQLQGIPLDGGHLLQLCRSVGVHDGLYFRPRAKRSVRRSKPGPPLAECVEPLTYLIEPEHLVPSLNTEWVTGIVIENPFRKTPTRTPLEGLPSGLEMLWDSGQLVCDMVHHHQLEDSIQESKRQYVYHLRGFEFARTSEALVCRPIVDWDKIETE